MKKKDVGDEKHPSDDCGRSKLLLLFLVPLPRRDINGNQWDEVTQASAHLGMPYRHPRVGHTSADLLPRFFYLVDARDDVKNLSRLQCQHQAEARGVGSR